jgi:hypothetical protein
MWLTYYQYVRGSTRPYVQQDNRQLILIHVHVYRWRDWCGLPIINTWEDLRGLMSNKTIANYASLYESPNDLDLWSAGISESPLTGTGILIIAVLQTRSRIKIMVLRNNDIGAFVNLVNIKHKHSFQEHYRYLIVKLICFSLFQYSILFQPVLAKYRSTVDHSVS